MKTIKILAISDEPSRALWEHFDPSRLEGVDLIISCGDLPAEYLSFLATFSAGPVLYVHGNHDEPYLNSPPEGCACIEDTVYEFEGIRIAGLGGSMRYNNGIFQYTERQMFFRTLRLQWRILCHRGLDILISHAPAHGVNDGDDIPHMGFKCFHRLLKRFHPKYFIHGHMHFSYNRRQKRICAYEDVTVINACGQYLFEYPLTKT